MSVYWWGWAAGWLHTALITSWSLLLADILLVRFRKVPFTCSYPPFRHSVIVVAIYCILGFFAFVVLTSRMEYWALLEPALMFLFVPMGFGRGTHWPVCGREPRTSTSSSSSGKNSPWRRPPSRCSQSSSDLLDSEVETVSQKSSQCRGVGVADTRGNFVNACMACFQ